MYYTYYMRNISPAARCIIQAFYTVRQGSRSDPVSYWSNSDQYPALVNTVFSEGATVFTSLKLDDHGSYDVLAYCGIP
jgi:hypothetical protein